MKSVKSRLARFAIAAFAITSSSLIGSLTPNANADPAKCHSSHVHSIYYAGYISQTDTTDGAIYIGANNAQYQWGSVRYHMSNGTYPSYAGAYGQVYDGC